MKFDKYQRRARETAVYPTDIGLAYVALGLAGEAGEIANKVKKVYRDHGGELDTMTKAELHNELGDVLWYVAALATELDVPLEHIAQHNMDKLLDRKKRGALRGSGDNR